MPLPETVVVKVIEAGSALGSNALVTAGLVYGAFRLGKSIEALAKSMEVMGLSMENGLKGIVSTHGSGADHLEAGLEKLGDKLTSRPLVVKATVVVAKEQAE